MNTDYLVTSYEMCSFNTVEQTFPFSAFDLKLQFFCSHVFTIFQRSLSVLNAHMTTVEKGYLATLHTLYKSKYKKVGVL